MPNYNYPYGGYPSVPPVAYQQNATTPYYYQNQTMPNQQYNQYQQPMQNYANAVNNKNIIWVAGQAGAEAYQLEPGSRAVLLDSKDQVFYIKVVGADGRPEPLMAFKYEPLNLNLQNENSQMAMPDMSNYVTKEDFNELKRMLEEATSKRTNSNPKGMNHNG